MMITAQDIYDKMNLKAVQDDDDYVENFFADCFLKEIENDISKYFVLKRGDAILTPKTSKLIDEIWEELRQKLNKKLEYDAYFVKRAIHGCVNSKPHLINQLKIKTNFVSVRNFLDSIKIKTYSIVKNSSRAIESNEFSRCLIGFYSHLMRKGLIAFETKKGVIKAYFFEAYFFDYYSYHASMREISLSKMRELLDFYTNEDLRIQAKGDNFSFVYIPKLGQGAFVIGGDVAVRIGSEIMEPMRDDIYKPIRSWVVEDDEEKKLLKTLIENFDDKNCYYEDPDCKEKFDMAMIAQEV